MLGLLAPLRSRLSAGLAGSGSHGLFEISPSIGSQTFMREPCGADMLLTEMKDEELLKLVALDLGAAMEE